MGWSESESVLKRNHWHLDQKPIILRIIVSNYSCVPKHIGVRVGQKMPSAIKTEYFLRKIGLAERFRFPEFLMGSLSQDGPFLCT